MSSATSGIISIEAVLEEICARGDSEKTNLPKYTKLIRDFKCWRTQWSNYVVASDLSDSQKVRRLTEYVPQTDKFLLSRLQNCQSVEECWAILKAEFYFGEALLEDHMKKLSSYSPQKELISSQDQFNLLAAAWENVWSDFTAFKMEQQTISPIPSSATSSPRPDCGGTSLSKRGPACFQSESMGLKLTTGSSVSALFSRGNMSRNPFAYQSQSSRILSFSRMRIARNLIMYQPPSKEMKLPTRPSKPEVPRISADGYTHP